MNIHIVPDNNEHYWQLVINELRLLRHNVYAFGPLWASDDACAADYVIGSRGTFSDVPQLRYYRTKEARDQYYAADVRYCNSYCKPVIVMHTLDIIDHIVKFMADKDVFIKIKMPIARNKEGQRLEDAALELGITLSETEYLVLQGDDGTLVMHHDGHNEWYPMPGWIERATTLLSQSSVVLDGLADDGTVVRRRETCLTCPLHTDQTWCGSCGCLTEAKIKLAGSRCPTGRW